jgi:hypothetical protein
MTLSRAFRIALFMAALVAPAEVAARQPATVSGYVRDAGSGETLILANVFFEGTQTGAATNTAGYYVIGGVEPGSYRLLASYLGYRTASFDLAFEAGEHLRLDIELERAGVTVGEVVVEARRETSEESSRLGVARLSTADIRALPTVLEPDVFRSLQLLPGVKAASDYSSGLYVRGGSPDQTLILLDQTTVYNPTHFFGFFSTFNPDAIKDVRLYKGGFPAEYGGRIGSVVDVYNKDGNRRRTSGKASVGLLASRALLEGPFRGGSWMVAFRRSTLEPLLAALRSADIDGIPDGFYFYDLNAKVNVDLSDTDRLAVAGYFGRDALDLEIVTDTRLILGYGNRTGSVGWTHLFSDNVFSSFTLTSSRYYSRPDFLIATTVVSRDNEVDDLSVKGDVEYVASSRFGMKGGFWAGNFTFRLRDVFDSRESMSERISARYGSAYLQASWSPGADFSVLGGLRSSWFGEGNHLRLEPRVSMEYRMPSGVRLQAGYGRYAQFLTLISNEAFSGLDIWLTTGDGVPPAYGDQFVTGIKGRLPGAFDLEIEGYYRTMRSIFQFDPFLINVSGLEYEEMFQFGHGYAVGTEVLLSRTTGRLGGQVGYTLGATRRRFPDINDGEYYPPKYDRTHDLNAILNVDLSRRWRLTTVFTYATGQAYTEPASQYRLVEFPLGGSELQAIISPFNAARLPDYHRLDVGFLNRGRFLGFADYEFQLQVINVYSRRNIWFYFFEFEDDGTVTREEVPQIPIPIPNLSFSLSF